MSVHTVVCCVESTLLEPAHVAEFKSSGVGGLEIPVPRQELSCLVGEKDLRLLDRGIVQFLVVVNAIDMRLCRVRFVVLLRSRSSVGDRHCKILIQTGLVTGASSLLNNNNSSCDGKLGGSEMQK